MKRYEQELEHAKRIFKENYGCFIKEEVLEYQIRGIERYIEILKEIKIIER